MSVALAHVTSTAMAMAYAKAATMDARRGARGRNHPDVVRSSMVRITVLCAFACAVVIWRSQSYDGKDVARLGAMRIVGLVPAIGNGKAAACGSALAFALTFGAFAEVVARRKVMSRAKRVREIFVDVREFRDLAHAPLCEEFCFRACAASLTMMAGSSASATIWVTSAAFGAAHGHHYFDMRRQGVSHANASRAVAMQCAYTTLFGAFATAIFLYTESLIAVVVAHSWCNLIGPPQTFALRGSPMTIAITMSHVLGFVFVMYVLYDAYAEPYGFARRLVAPSHWLA